MSRMLLPFKVCWRLLKPVLLALDRVLVLFATPFGVNSVEPRKQYARFFSIYAVILIFTILPVPILPFVTLLIGYIGVIAVGRAWVNNENRRAAIAKKLADGQPDELPDLRGLALVSACQLFWLFPLLFRQAQNSFCLFEVHGEADFLSWFWFALDKTYLKALPDWSVLYNVHVSSIDFDSPWGQHLVLFTRLTFDFVLIQGLKRLYDIHQTIRDGVAAVKQDPDMAVRLGQRAIDPLIWLLKDHDRSMRCRAAEALGQLGDVRVVEPLVLALRDRDKDVRNNAAQALAGLGDVRAVEPLILALTDQIWFHAQSSAAESLGRLGDARAVEPLILALKDKVEWVRWKVAEALGRLRDSRAVEPLILALDDHFHLVRWNAAEALGELRDSRAVEPLILALKDQEGTVRKNAAQSLGKLANFRAVEPLILVLNDQEAYVRKNAAEALGRLGDIRAVEPLILALKDRESDVRASAAEALGKLGNASAVEPLKLLLMDQAEEVRKASTVALGCLGCTLS